MFISDRIIIIAYHLPLVLDDIRRKNNSIEQGFEQIIAFRHSSTTIITAPVIEPPIQDYNFPSYFSG